MKKLFRKIKDCATILSSRGYVIITRPNPKEFNISYTYDDIEAYTTISHAKHLMECAFKDESEKMVESAKDIIKQ